MQWYIESNVLGQFCASDRACRNPAFRGSLLGEGSFVYLCVVFVLKFDLFIVFGRGHKTKPQARS